MCKKTCALVIGHRKRSPGAFNFMSGMTEFAFNQSLANDIKKQINDINIVIINRHTFKKLPADINRHKPDFIISLHCNAYNCNTSGTEVLYYHKSEKGRQIASILQHHLVTALGLKDRGIKPKHVEDRGGYLLKETIAPCIIAEPFFIDNNHDLNIAIDNKENLISAYEKAINVIATVVTDEY